MLLGKRGDTIFGLKQLISLILSLIVIVFLVIIGTKLWLQFSGKEVDEASVNNFDSLVEAINRLMASKEDTIAVPYYIRGGFTDTQVYGLFGFLGETPRSRRDAGTESHLTSTCDFLPDFLFDGKHIQKDFVKCAEDDACLCLVQKPGAKKENMIKCFSNTSIEGYFVNTNSKFKDPYAGIDLIEPPKISTYGEFSTLVIWGACKTFVWNVRTLYIKKIEFSEGRYYLVFSSGKFEPYEPGGGEPGGAGAGGLY